MITRASLPLLALLATTVSASTRGQVGSMPSGALTIGDRAPAIRVAKWIKGTPLESFESGKVYVVDFWSTWAELSGLSIPRLTELQKKYGESVSFSGIAVFQKEPASNYAAAVGNYVTKLGPKAGYRIAIDTAPRLGTMAKTWMTAAGLNVVPSTFVIGKDGRIAWIGNPTDAALPKTLDAILGGTYDAAAARASAIQQAQASAAIQATFGRVHEAYKQGQDATADAAMDALVAKYPEAAGMVLNVRFYRHLDKGREQKAQDLLRSQWKSVNLSSDDLNTFAWDLLTSEQIKTRDYPLAIELAKKGVELTAEKNAAIIDTLALGYFLNGTIEDAIKWEQKAVTLTGGKDEEMVAALAKYKRAKGQ